MWVHGPRVSSPHALISAENTSQTGGVGLLVKQTRRRVAEVVIMDVLAACMCVSVAMRVVVVSHQSSCACDCASARGIVDASSRSVGCVVEREPVRGVLVLRLWPRPCAYRRG